MAADEAEHDRDQRGKNARGLPRVPVAGLEHQTESHTGAPDDQAACAKPVSARGVCERVIVVGGIVTMPISRTE